MDREELALRNNKLTDAFHAMTSDRPYREAMSRYEAIEEVARCSGTQFDPEVVSTLVEMVAKEAMSALLHPVS